MKKAFFILLAIVAAFFLVANADYLAEFLDAVQAGAVVPIVIAIIVMLLRHVTQAKSYQEAFKTVGFFTGLWHNIVLIFSLVFINTFCLFSGATGVAFIIDDAHRKGADIGTSTSGAILSQIGYFAAIFVISVIGFVTMMLAGTLNVLFLIGGLLLMGTLLVLSSLFVIGYFKPDWLYGFFDKLQRVISKIIGVVKKSLPVTWGSATADSFIDNSRILAHNPAGTATTVAWASASAILNMMCLVAIGYAFGFAAWAPLIAAFALAAVSVILSPTPQGVGVVEAAITAILVGSGCDLAVATAIALVYRGIMFWIPFCIGAVLLSQSGFFQNKESASQHQKMRDIGWVSGMFVAIVGIVNLVLGVNPSLIAPYEMITQWVNITNMVVGPSLIATGVLLIILAVGLVLRLRTAWAVTITLLVLLCGIEFGFYSTVSVAIPILALVIWLFIKRKAFCLPFSWPPEKPWGKIAAEGTQDDKED